ncbi:MAG: beta-ketoacyl-[Clostridia bacterium]|nr:beta-ketoacyl-[acyl-carrier-protein] synthase family protein [Clostridia bacterium]
MERVVVTGIGIVSAIGMGVDEFWINAVKGRDGITKIERFDTAPYRSDMGGEIKDFAPYTKRLYPESLGRVSQYAASAARLAYEDADACNIYDIAGASVFMGTGIGEAGELKRARYSADMGTAMKTAAASNITVAVRAELGLSGDAVILPNACTAGNYAITDAYERIKNGRIPYAFAGGADALFEEVYLGFSQLRAISTGKCRPFDKDHDGMAVGEGAAVLFLETYKSAAERGARIYAEIIGWGASCDAHSMVVPPPDGNGIKRAMAEALADARITCDDVDYISAHGTGTVANDRAEAAAINSLFGRRLPVSSIKSMIGHAMGAASAIEAAVCCLAIKTGVIPPTINFREPEAEHDIDCVPNTARRVNVRIAMNNASAFGGANSCVIFREV